MSLDKHCITLLYYVSWFCCHDNEDKQCYMYVHSTHIYVTAYSFISRAIGATHSYKGRQASLPVESGALVLGVWKRQLQVWGAPASPTISLSLKETSPVPVFASVITHSGFGGRDKNFPLQHGMLLEVYLLHIRHCRKQPQRCAHAHVL